MSKEAYIFTPIKVIINDDNEVIGLVESVSLEDCNFSYKEIGSYYQKDLMLFQLKELFINFGFLLGKYIKQEFPTRIRRKKNSQ